MENAQIADLLDETADLLELASGDPFRIRAYREAARTVRTLPRRCEDLAGGAADFRELPHVGKSMAEHIAEILRTGACGRLLELRRKVPPALTTLLKVPQLGPRRARLVYDELGVTSLDELKKACEAHRLAAIKSLGIKTEENILRGLSTLGAGSGRMLYKEASDHAEALGRHLSQLKTITRWEIAGSFRRRKETVGDLDVLVVARDRTRAAAEILNYASIAEVTSRGAERVAVRLDGGLQVDFRFFEPKEIGAAQLYFTGSKAHNIALRKLVLKHRWKLNEYGLYRGRRRIAGATEEEVYAKLGLAWIPPELREDRGEIEAAARGELPELIELADIHGDLHCHTKATDGADSIEAMATAAQARGYEYLAITDHSKAVAIVKGLNEARLKKHVEAIRKVAASLEGERAVGRGRARGFWLLAGVEVDILRDGRLDLDERVLASLDWVVASVHSHFHLDEAAMTKRLLAAVRSGVVHCLGHPLGRIIGRREPIQADWQKIFAACREHRVRIEINAQPDRLDMPDHLCQLAKAAGVGFVISTDAHKQSDLEFMPLGVGMARRGWLERHDVLNTLSSLLLRKNLRK
ncbi:MAG TPA: DNA polymerase/3'-5' exonuclease PolX [Opitutaceae bacterium]